MKKILSLAILMAACLTAQAQFYVGGSFLAEAEKVKVDDASEKASAFGITPEVGYSFNEVWSAGLECELEFASTDGSNNDHVIYGFNPYVRANFAHVGHVHFFAKLQAGIGIDHVADTNNTIWNVGFGPGFSVPLTDRLHLETSFPLFQFGQEKFDHFDVNTTKFQLNNSVMIGVVYYL